MAKILLIKTETERDGLQYINDIVGVYDDSHIFSDHELQVFNVLTINGSVADVKARIEQITPTIETAFLWTSDGEWHFDYPEDPEADPILDVIQVYQVEGDNKWYHAVSDFKFPTNIGDLTPEEKQLLETVNINHPSVDSFIRKIVKDITQFPGNDVEIKDLKNQTP